MADARCGCGAVTLSLPEEPSKLVVARHCLDCQRRTGAVRYNYTPLMLSGNLKSSHRRRQREKSASTVRLNSLRKLSNLPADRRLVGMAKQPHHIDFRTVLLIEFK